MSKTATYHTTVRWKGEHWGHLVMGNGPEYGFLGPARRARVCGRLHAGGRLRRRGEHLRDDDVHLGRRAVQAQAAFLRVPHGGHQVDRTGPHRKSSPGCISAP